jgi:outer membrane protein assembly factor BamB
VLTIATVVVLATTLTDAAAAQDRGASATGATVTPPPRAGAIAWQWNEEAGPAGRAFSVSVERGASVDVARARDGKVMGLRKYGSGGGEIWAVQLLAPTARNVAFLVHDGTLYIALYKESATGAELAAIDIKTGRLLFRAPLRALGPVRQSKVRNRVQLRFVDPWVVVFGDESGGRYIEALDAKTGATVSNRKLHR